MMRTRVTTCLAAAVLVFSCARSAFSKDTLPVAAEATEVASAWLRAAADMRVPQVARVSAYPFRVLGFEGPKCKGDKTARDESDLVGVVQCVDQELVSEETRRDLSRNDLAVLDEKTLKGAGWKQQRKYLRGLLREERLVWRLYPDEDILHIVVLGVRTTPDGPRVTSFTYHTDMLGE